MGGVMNSANYAGRIIFGEYLMVFFISFRVSQRV